MNHPPDGENADRVEPTNDAHANAEAIAEMAAIPTLGSSRRKPETGPLAMRGKRKPNWTLRLVFLLVYTVLSWAGISKAIQMADGTCFGPICITNTEVETTFITKENDVE